MNILRRSQLADADRVRLEDVIRQFQENWSSDGMKSLPAAFEHYLPQTKDAVRAVALQELVTLDMESRWRIGQKVRLEFYLSAFPEIEEDPDRVVALMHEEFRVRSTMQEPVEVTSFKSRFPDYFEAFHRFVRNQGSTMGPAVTDTIRARPQPTAPADGRSFVPDFSRYELEKRLGAGQFGEVWLAKAPGGVDVALKIIPWPSAHKMSQMELRALEVMKRMRHAFLIQVHAYWPMENQVAIVMELADGSLEDRLKEVRAEGEMGIERDELTLYMREAAEALDYLHGQQILHRDIKPANILVIERHAKLGDFGVARLVNREQNQDVRATCVGTPQFMPPEVWDNRACAASDQYSLAVTYVELRLGRPVFMAESLGELLRSHSTMKPDLEPMPAAEQDVVLKALAKDPDKRYPTCVEFVAALEEVAMRESTREKDRLSNRRKMLIGIPLALTAVAVVLTPFVMGWGQRDREPALDLAEQFQLTAGGGPATLIVRIDTPVDDDREITPDDVKVTGLPDDISLEISSLEGRPHEVRLTMDAPLNTEAESFDLGVEATFAGYDFAQDVAVSISFPEMYVPARCRPAPHATRIRTGQLVCYSHLYMTLPNGVDEVEGLPIEFVLVPSRRAQDPAAFYIMKNKVWNRLFGEFVASRDGSGVADDWRTIDGEFAATDYPRWPVLNLYVNEAQAFCQWVGGTLPTPAQWAKASGWNDHQLPEYDDYVEGPYIGTWDGDAKKVNVGADNEMPCDVGTATHDISPFGCHDMAGNGWEFTNAFETTGPATEQFPLQNPTFADRIRTVGEDFFANQPLQYLPGQMEPGQKPYRTRGHTSFRVVLNIDPR